ncbi:uncharacterized protein RSE6_16141 [Rhynchosporium secalis]|uniref:Reverse transcriptase domain-containing protein n=1 Tax=Rhynchosporium secalis TaxID=38038 RepID=A0A1E1MVH0_RHYSE|nr:uncharacterized protein RSE6_16141 [Rhynchosporium secalis]
MLDVSSAFDNISYERLLYNIRKRRLSTEIIDQAESYLKDYTTRIKLADLLEIERDGELITRYINDIGFLVEGSSIGDTRRFRERDLELDLRGGRIVLVINNARYLRVILDKELNGLVYIEYIKKRVEVLIQALRAIISSKWGAIREDMLILVKVIIIL